MRKILAALILGAAAAMPAAAADVRVNIGINLPVYPTLQRIPNYPVYYAPSVHGNYFFYDGLYWVFVDDDWYASHWYNGPWHFVDRFDVPAYLLRVPVRYYRYAPATFRSWRADAPPLWHVYWGNTWASRRSGWDHWDIRSAPAPAPLPLYQRNYARDRYPSFEEQRAIASRNYRYEPRDQVTRQVYRDRVLSQRSQRIDDAAPDASGQARAVQRAQREEARAQRVEQARAQRFEPRAQRLEEVIPPAQRIDDGAPDASAQGVARGHTRDERGIPAHARGKAKGHDRDEDDRGRGRGRDKD